jgi:hypothetical protein
MTHQVTLSDEEYAALAGTAAERGTAVEVVLRELLDEWYPALRRAEQRAMDPLVASMYRAGHLRELPTGAPDTPEIAAERARLARPAAPGQLVSEMVIDDRGPR